MRGFQPETQNFADGGLVSRIKGALGFTPKDDKKKAQATSAAPAPAPAPEPSPAPAPSPEPKTALGQYAAGSALKRRMAEIDSYADGGPVRGPGTGISDEVPDEVAEGTYIMPADSTQAIGEQKLATMGKADKVPVNLSNGEFKLPPEQVHAIGVQALNQMKDATHTPVAARGFVAGAQPQAQGEPRQFFADGGVVDEENAKRFVKVPTSIGHQPGRQQPATPAAPAQQGMTDAQREQAISQIPTGGVASPARPAPMAPAAPTADPMAGMAATGFMPHIKQPTGIAAGSAGTRPAEAAQVPVTEVEGWRTKAVMDGAAQDAQAAWDRGSVAGAAGAVTRGAITAIPTAVGEFAYNTLAPVARGLGSFYDGLTGAQSDANPATTAPGAPAQAKAVPAAAAAPVPAGAAAGAGRAGAAAAAPSTSPAAPAAATGQPEATQIAPGVFRSGNSYSDSATGALAAVQPRGLPSAQNMAAADALAQRSQAESMGRITAAQPVERGWSGVIGTDPAASAGSRERQDLVSSLTTPLRGAQNGQLTAAQRNGMLQLMDQEARGAQARANNANALQQTEMQTGAQRDIATMREAGESSRAGARNAIDQGRLGLEQQVRGFDIRSGQRQEKLYERYDAAKTPEERSAIAQQIRDLSGKTEPANRFTVVPGGQEWDATAGVMRNVPGRVFNNQSGQFVNEGGGAGSAPPAAPQDMAKRVVGQTYTAPNGQTVKWTANGWLPVN